MRCSPPISPAQPDDVDVYLLLDDFGGRLGRAWRETNEGETDRATLIRYLLEGQYNCPVLIVAFNLAEGRARDVTEDIANELLKLCAERDEVPQAIADFIFQHTQ